MLSCLGLYIFLCLIMLYPVPAIDNFLEVRDPKWQKLMMSWGGWGGG